MGSTRSEAERTAHEYLRVSVDGSGIEESQSEQHEDNERTRLEEGWRRGRSYKDTGSASRYARKTRDDFGRLIADLRGGVFKPGDVLQLWESSRGSREQAEWATFLNLLRDSGVLLHVTSHRRLYDLNIPRDRRTLDEDGVDSAYESAKTSMRIKRHMAANAAKGRPHGPVPFGYRRTYDPDTGRLVSQVPKEGEAEVVRELFERLAQRHSLRSMANATSPPAGSTTTPGPRSARSICASWPSTRRMRVCGCMTPAATGVAARQRRPQSPRVGGSRWWIGGGSTSCRSSSPRQAAEPTADRPGRAVHEFSMILKCGVCGGPLSARSGRVKGVNDLQYQCHRKSCVRINKAELDSFATDAILAALRSRELYQALTPINTDHDAEVGAVRDKLAESAGPA